ncbi:hypothetical protein [Microbulbifer agarilyticus]
MSAYKTLKEGLTKLGLEGVPGSIFDNSFSVFERAREELNLVVVGTNGNTSDRVNSTLGWLDSRASQPEYCHLKDGDWGRTILQPQLLEIPSCLNSALGTNKFSVNLTVYTNALLLASNGVNDIGNCVRELRTSSPKFQSKKDIAKASMQFFANYTLSLASPDFLFVYGNSEPGDSAWAYLRRHFEVVEEGVNLPLTSSTAYKFCTIKILGKIIPVIGSPHLSYAYNKLNPSLIREGITELGLVQVGEIA